MYGEIKKGGSDDWWKIPLLFLGGGLLLYGIKVAIEEQKSGAPVPADPGGRIDRVVAALNQCFNHNWVAFGLNALRGYLSTVLPPSEVAQVDVIYNVESAYASIPRGGPYKRQLAIQQMQNS